MAQTSGLSFTGTPPGEQPDPIEIGELLADLDPELAPLVQKVCDGIRRGHLRAARDAAERLHHLLAAAVDRNTF